MLVSERKKKLRTFVKLIAEGHTTESAASLVGMGKDWGKKWRQRKEVKQRIEEAKMKMIGNVKASMYKSAVLGDEKITEGHTPDGSIYKVEKLPPNVHAQKYLLDRYDKEDKVEPTSKLEAIPIDKILIAVQNNFLLPKEERKEVLEVESKPKFNPFFENYDRKSKQWLGPEMDDTEYVKHLLEEGIDVPEE